MISLRILRAALEKTPKQLEGAPSEIGTYVLVCCFLAVGMWATMVYVIYHWWAT